MCSACYQPPIRWQGIDCYLSAWQSSNTIQLCFFSSLRLFDFYEGKSSKSLGRREVKSIEVMKRSFESPKLCLSTAGKKSIEWESLFFCFFVFFRELISRGFIIFPLIWETFLKVISASFPQLIKMLLAQSTAKILFSDSCFLAEQLRK